MPIVSLPDPDASVASSLRDAGEARIWLANQPQAQPLRLLRALLKEIRAIDYSVHVPGTRMELLDALRGAVIQAEASAVIRYAHKPLPLLEDEHEAFANARNLWHALAAAYLRVVPLLPAPLMLQAMHRGAVALREALHCHFVAGIEVPVEYLRLLYEILTTAESQGMQRTAVSDPDITYLSSTIAGDIAWSFLLLFSDPYRFSPAQFNVMNRAFSRWSDLAGFQSEPPPDRKSKAIPLSRWLGEGELLEGRPQWLEVRPVIRKIRQRIEALQAGEMPEKLKLGRELTPSACIRLLRDLDHVLRPDPKPIGDFLDQDTVGLVFGNEHLYTLLSGKMLVDKQLNLQSERISYDRMKVFGFDNMVARIDHAGDSRVPAEIWTVEDNWILRAAPDGGQMVAPLLVGIRPENDEAPSLAIVEGLRQTNDGWLAANLRILPGVASSGIQKVVGVAMAGAQPGRQPVFLVTGGEHDGAQPSICFPTGSGLRPGSLLALEEAPIEHIRLGEILERGSNFVRFAYVGT